jgi:hypothetical protein
VFFKHVDIHPSLAAVPDQRHRASDVRFETAALLRGSVRPLVHRETACLNSLLFTLRNAHELHTTFEFQYINVHHLPSLPAELIQVSFDRLSALAFENSAAWNFFGVDDSIFPFLHVVLSRTPADILITRRLVHKLKFQESPCHEGSQHWLRRQILMAELLKYSQEKATGSSGHSQTCRRNKQRRDSRDMQTLSNVCMSHGLDQTTS